METRSGTLWATICLWVCYGWHWPAVLHPLAGADGGSVLLVSWCLERGSTGQMWFPWPGWNWALLRCLLLLSTTPLAGSGNPSLGYSFLPYCGGCSHHEAGGQQIHAHPKADPSGTEGNRIKQQGWRGHGCWRAKWIWRWEWLVRSVWQFLYWLRMHHLRGLVSGLWPRQVWHSLWGVPWFVCRTVWHWHWRALWVGLASKLIGSLKDTAFRSWLPTVTRMHTMEKLSRLQRTWHGS